MRYVVGFVLALTLVASPLNVSAQTENESPSRLERWHPEAFKDPSKPASEPALRLEVDSTALEVTPTVPPTLKELEQQEAQRRRRLGLGIGLGLVALVVVVGIVGTRTALSGRDIL